MHTDLFQSHAHFFAVQQNSRTPAHIHTHIDTRTHAHIQIHACTQERFHPITGAETVAGAGMLYLYTCFFLAFAIIVGQ
jgi:hypothetical protein